MLVNFREIRTTKIIQKLLIDLLDELFPNPKVPLDHESPYTLLIATLLSAQCTDKKVNEVTPKLFSIAKTPSEMVKLSIEEIFLLIKPCGLGNIKSKAIWNLSKELLDKHGGVVPVSFNLLEALPCVGHKTASCVMAHSFNIPVFPVDTHIHRIAHRWGLSSGKSVIQTETDLKAFFPNERWNLLHLQMIYYARTYCPAKGHLIENCPICKLLSAIKKELKTL